MSQRILTAALLMVLAAAGQAADDDFNPERFLQDNCTRCHDSSVYTREDRKVHSLEALRNQVKRCDSMLGTKLYDDELDKLTDHLNQRYYHF